MQGRTKCLFTNDEHRCTIKVVNYRWRECVIACWRCVFEIVQKGTQFVPKGRVSNKASKGQCYRRHKLTRWSWRISSRAACGSQPASFSSHTSLYSIIRLCVCFVCVCVCGRWGSCCGVFLCMYV